MTTLDSKCPNCASVLKFNPKTQRLECEFCKKSFQVENISHKKLDDTQKYRGYICNNCGAEIILNENTSATSCIYCKNTAIIETNLTGNFNPKMIIPFKKTKEDAIKAFKEITQDKKLAPDDFSDENNIKEMTGIYIPFWLVDSNIAVDCEYEGIKTDLYKYEELAIKNGRKADIGDLIEKVKVIEDIKGKSNIKDDMYKVMTNQINDTESKKKYLVKLSGNINFDKIPIDGSKKFQDDIMTSIEPFNYDELVDFNYSYLSGFLSEKYDVGQDVVTEIFNRRLDDTIYKLLDDEVKKGGYLYINKTSSNINILNKEMYYVLLPVWMLNIKYKNKIHTFAMNGQTGKLIGNIPMDKTKKDKKKKKFSIVCTIILLLITLPFMLPFIIFAENITISILMIIFMLLSIYVTVSKIPNFIVEREMHKYEMIHLDKNIKEYIKNEKINITKREDNYIGIAISEDVARGMKYEIYKDQ